MPVTVDVADVYPNGTSVSAYPQRAQVPGAGPLGPATDTATVASGQVTFDGLTTGEAYAAYGTVDGSLVRVDFNVDRPPHIQLYTDEDATITGDWAFEAELDLSAATLVGPIASVVFNVKDYEAVGDGTTDDTDAVQAAITACIVAGGGTVYFPPGTYLLTATLSIPAPDVNSKNVNLLGAGAAASTLKWSTALGATAFGIDPSNGPDDTQPYDFKKRTIRNLHIEGPTDDWLAAGGRKGIRWASDLIIENCLIEQWSNGLYAWGNHQALQNSRVRECYFGIYWPNGLPTIGDQYVSNSDLSGNRWASVACGNNTTVAADFERVHMGFAPYGIYQESGGSSAGWYQSRFTKVYGESLGAAFIKTNGHWIQRCSFRDIWLSKSDAYARGETCNAVIDLGTGTMQDCDFEFAWYFDATASTTPPAFIKAGAIVRTNFRSFQNVMDFLITNNWRFADLSTADCGDVDIEWGGNRATLAYTSEAVSQYEALGLVTQFTGSLVKVPVVRRANDGDKLVGVAQHGAAINTIALAQYAGDAVVQSTGAIAALALAAPANFGTVKTDPGSVPIAGLARYAAASNFVGLRLGPTLK